MLVGFLDSFLSMETIPCRLPNECSKTLVLKSEEEVFMSGEAILWKDFGNALRRSEPEYVYKDFVDACRARGYNPTYIEYAYDSFMPENHENREGPSASRIFESDSTPQKEADSRETRQILETETEGPQTSGTKQDQGPRDEPFSISGIEDSKHGVLRCLIGPYNVYVVHREAGGGTEMACTLHRYRVYIPALCMGQFFAPGFSSWSDILASPNEIQIRNTAYSSGHSREYFKKVWFPHVSLCSPLLLGEAPLSHNTPVEVSFKRTKHHSELGVEAMQRPGGMPISEYDTKAAEFSMSNALRVSHNLIKKRNSSGILKHPQISKKKKKSLAELTRETNPSVSNARILDGVFLRKKAGESPGGGFGDGQSAHPVPATQQSQTEAANEEERWVKRRRILTREAERFFETMITAKEAYFGEWSLKRIAAFLECAYLGMKAMKIDKGTLSRIYRKEALPGQKRCSFLLEICRSHLPVRTVDDEFTETDFCLLPGAEKRIEDVITSSRSAEEGGQFNSIFGDAKVSTDDIIRLVRPDSWNGNGQEERFWLSGDTINFVTNLYCSLRNDRSVFIFDTYFVQKYCDTYFNKNIGEERKRERLEDLRQSQKRTRSGQKSSFEEAQIVFVPCLVNTNHWVGFRVNKPNSTLDCIDSMPMKKLDPGGRYSFPILKLLVSMSGKTFTYTGQDKSFPQQENSMDCAVLMLLGCRAWILGRELDKEVSGNKRMSLWRQRIAHEIITKRAT